MIVNMARLGPTTNESLAFVDVTKIARRTIATAVSASDLAQLERHAREHERSLAGELRRALRYYLSNFDVVDQALREQALTRERSAHA
jgi:hypothetical protein